MTSAFAESRAIGLAGWSPDLVGVESQVPRDGVGCGRTVLPSRGRRSAPWTVNMQVSGLWIMARARRRGVLYVASRQIRSPATPPRAEGCRRLGSWWSALI